MAELVRFGDLFASPLRNGVSYPSRLRGEGVPMVNMREIFAYDRISDQECERVPLTHAERTTYLLEPGDLLFARQSLTFEGAGKCVLVQSASEPRTWEGHLMRVRLDQKRAEPAYFFYYFASRVGRAGIETIIQQVAAAGIRGSDLGNLLVSVPPLAEQRAIAEVLGALDDKIAANNRVAAMARELARVSYDRAVHGAQTETMSRLLAPFLGGTPSRADAALWDGSVPWVSAKDVTGAAHGVITDTVEGISESAATTKRLRPLPAGSVVLTARGTVGVVARLGIASAINQSCYGFVPDRVPPGCLTFVIEDASAQAKAMAHGSVFDTITMRTFDHVQVPALSDGEWHDVEPVVAPLLEMTSQAVVESERLARTRDELLPLLMSGKVCVKDAEKTVKGVL